MERENNEPLRLWLGDFLFDSNNSDVLRDFRELGEKNGFLVVKSTETFDAVFLLNYRIKDLLTLLLKFRSRETPKFQLVTEPSVTLPLFRYENLWRRLFHKRYVLGVAASGIRGWQKPQNTRNIQSTISKDRLQSAVIVNSNKFSFVREEFYTLRRRIAARSNLLFVFGSGWDQSLSFLLRKTLVEFLRALVVPHALQMNQGNILKKPINFKGVALDKLACMSQFEVALIIENSPELLTEKIHDAWFAGCFPIYVGPDLNRFDIPQDLYLQVQPSVNLIDTAIKSVLSTTNFAKFRKSLAQWLSSNSYRLNFDEEVVWSQMFVDLRNELRSYKHTSSVDE